MARNNLRIWFKYDGTAVDAYDIDDHNYLNNPSTKMAPSCNDGLQFYKDGNELLIPMGSGWFRIPIPTNASIPFRVRFRRNGAPKQIDFWRDDIQRYDSRDDESDPDDATPEGDPLPFYKMCTHSMVANLVNEMAETNAAFAAVVRCKWILIAGIWYCMPY
jgi:hypothetical protein